MEEWMNEGRKAMERGLESMKERTKRITKAGARGNVYQKLLTLH